MAKIRRIIELPNTLILTDVDDIVSINKKNVKSILNYLQDSQETTKYLQVESQFQHDEIQQNNQHYKTVYI